MKIALDAQSLFEEKKTGIGWTIENIINHMELLPENEYQLNYFAFRGRKAKKGMMEHYEQKGYRIKTSGTFPLGVYHRIWNFLPIPYAWFMGHDTDITQFFNYVIPPGVKGKTGVYIYDMVYKACPETMEDTTRAYMEKHMKKSCKRADFIITISEFSKREIVKYMNVDADKVKVVPCGVDLSVYQPDIAEEQVMSVKKKFGIDDSYFLYLGTLEPRKNVPLIIEAYYELKERLKTNIPKLVIAGKKGWGYQAIFEKVQNYDLLNDVIFTGYVSEEEKPVLLKGAICFLFPSLYEGFGMPPLEAMACGTPVIVSNQASLPEVVGDAGLYVEVNDCESMSQYMELLSSDGDYRSLIGEQGREQAEQFSWFEAAKDLLKVYEAL